MKAKPHILQGLQFYCIPYAFLAIYAHAENHSLLLYGVMAAALGILCWKHRQDLLTLILGNLLSGALSCICIEAFQQESWRSFFAPVRTLGLTLLITGAVLLLQVLFSRGCSLLRREKMVPQMEHHRSA